MAWFDESYTMSFCKTTWNQESFSLYLDLETDTTTDGNIHPHPLLHPKSQKWMDARRFMDLHMETSGLALKHNNQLCTLTLWFSWIFAKRWLIQLKYFGALNWMRPFNMSLQDNMISKKSFPKYGYGCATQWMREDLWIRIRKPVGCCK